MIGRKYSAIAPIFGACWCEDGQDSAKSILARFVGTCSFVR